MPARPLCTPLGHPKPGLPGPALCAKSGGHWYKAKTWPCAEEHKANTGKYKAGIDRKAPIPKCNAANANFQIGRTTTRKHILPHSRKAWGWK